MTGTLINFAAVLLGGALGATFKRFIRQDAGEAIKRALGVAVLVLSVCGVVTSMITADAGGVLSSDGFLLLIGSIAVGTLVGELLRLDDRLERLGAKLEKKLNMGNLAEGFVSATMIFCVGAMAVIGALNDGMTGDNTVLVAKSAIDCVCAVVLASTLGWGVALAALPVLLYQGAIALLAGAVSGFVDTALLNQIAMVGYTIMICIGLSVAGISRFKVVNMLPGMLGPILVRGVCLLFGW